jgi:hypothetical protein
LSTFPAAEDGVAIPTCSRSFLATSFLVAVPMRATRTRVAARLSVAVLIALGAVSLGAVSSGCAAPAFDGRLFRKDDVTFRLAHLPPSWRQIEINDTALAFRDDARGATVAINGRCGRDADDVPLQSLTQHLFLQFTERQIESQQLMPLDGREALETQMVAKLDGVEKHFHVVVLKKDGCVYDFLQIAGERQDAEAFRHFVSGFSSAS